MSVLEAIRSELDLSSWRGDRHLDTEHDCCYDYLSFSGNIAQCQYRLTAYS